MSAQNKDQPAPFKVRAGNENAPDEPQGENKDNGDTLPGAADRKTSGDTTKKRGGIGTGEGQTSPSAATSKLIDDGDADTSVADEISSGDKVSVYNVHAGLTPRVGGPYLDVVHLEEEEKRRAVVEKREPDFNNMAGSAGVPLVTAGQLVNAHAGSVPTNGVLTQMVDKHKDEQGFGPNPLGEVDAVGESVGSDLNVEKEVRRPDPLVSQEDITSHDQPDTHFADWGGVGGN